MKSFIISKMQTRAARGMFNFGWLAILALPLLLISACGAQATNTPLPTPTSTPGDPTIPPPACTAIGQTWVSPVDGMTLVCVPAGEFSMGSESSDAEPEEKPVHSVYLDAYWIDQTEVTNAMYQKCVGAGACAELIDSGSDTRENYYGTTEYSNYPVVYVSLDQAAAYCQWTGRELPSEAQWEKAARGTDGRTYPWGEDLGPSKANYDSDLKGTVTRRDTSAVGSYPEGKSPYGAYDMAGNVYEWVTDRYDVGYYSVSPARNPTGPASGEKRILRGGSYGDDAWWMRATFRLWVDPPTTGDPIVGFRCTRAPASQ